MRNLAPPAVTTGRVTPSPDWLTVALPRAANACYALFSDVERIPEWLSVIRSVVVIRRDRARRVREAAFLARLERATIGYTLRYDYRASERLAMWTTQEGSSMQVSGFAQFSPLAETSCLMSYSLTLEMNGLPGWGDPLFAGHAASATMSDFRDFVLRAL